MDDSWETLEDVTGIEELVGTLEEEDVNKAETEVDEDCAEPLCNLDDVLNGVGTGLDDDCDCMLEDPAEELTGTDWLEDVDTTEELYGLRGVGAGDEELATSLDWLDVTTGAKLLGEELGMTAEACEELLGTRGDGIGTVEVDCASEVLVE